MTAAEGGKPENINAIAAGQAKNIQDQVPGATIYPPASQPGGTVPSEFFYRDGHVLVRQQDLRDVLSSLTRLRPTLHSDDTRFERAEVASEPIPGLTLVKLIFSNENRDKDPDATARVMFSALEGIERQLGPGKAAPDHLLSITNAPDVVSWCPATEPAPPPPGATPQPPVSRSCCNGRGTLVAVVDQGLVEDAPSSHPWMLGVTGPPDPDVTEGVSIGLYGGHGTFIASIIRAMAPRSEVRVARVFETAGAAYESDVVKALSAVLDWAPDVISLSAGTHTWKSSGLLSFHVFVDGPLRECPGTVLVAAAGNDGANWKFSPAEMKSVIGVGALGPPGDALAWFSDYGDWVKVYAPGQDLVHAFARGTYTYQEQNPNTQATFTGMASWSGTSFSTPVVAGLIAARMSGTGESARDAAESLLRLARAQALPGVGPVLRPGQACLNVGEPPCGCGQSRGCEPSCQCEQPCQCGQGR